MRVRAAVARKPHSPFALEELELGSPRAGEILVRIVACGMCHADLIARDQDMPVPHPIVAGHEGAGVIEGVGMGVEAFQEGDHVLLSYSACHHCESCLSGHPAYCDEAIPRNFGGARPDGSTSLTSDSGPVHSHFFGQSSFASHVVAPARNAIAVPVDAPLDLYAPLGCGIQTGAGAVINTLKVPMGSGVAVFGTGSVGLSAVMAAHATGVATVVAIDVVPERLALAQELGADARGSRARGRGPGRCDPGTDRWARNPVRDRHHRPAGDRASRDGVADLYRDTGPDLAGIGDDTGELRAARAHPWPHGQGNSAGRQHPERVYPAPD